MDKNKLLFSIFFNHQIGCKTKFKTLDILLKIWHLIELILPTLQEFGYRCIDLFAAISKYDLSEDRFINPFIKYDWLKCLYDLEYSKV